MLRETRSLSRQIRIDTHRTRPRPAGEIDQGAFARWAAAVGGILIVTLGAVGGTAAVLSMRSDHSTWAATGYSARFTPPEICQDCDL
jgi:hypothetical protein